MTADTDFAALYRELGIDPGDGMDAFRRAYRRRVAELHPDRRSDGDGIDLQRLNAMYAAAIRFQRQYGRLPGTPAPAIAVESAAHVRSVQVDPDVRPAPARNRRVRTGYLLAAAVVLLAILLSSQQSDIDTAPTGVADGSAGSVAEMPALDSTRPLLQIGTPMQVVLQIQGAPVTTDGNRWIYGPSWLRFHCLEVVDWYSSPLHPLKARGSRPSTQAQRMHRPARPENCGKTALP